MEGVPRIVGQGTQHNVPDSLAAGREEGPRVRVPAMPVSAFASPPADCCRLAMTVSDETGELDPFAPVPAHYAIPCRG